MTLEAGIDIGNIGGSHPDPSAGATNRPADDARPHPAGSISFIIVTENSTRHAGTVVDIVGRALRDGDEAILLTRPEGVGDLPGPPRPWLRIIGIPDGSLFVLHSHIPAIARCDWVVLLEEHALVTPATLDALRATIRERPEINLISFVVKNTISVSAWGWACFLHNFALIWAPLDHAPAFSPVTSVAVRREAFDRETPLREGEWELRLIPRIFAQGPVGYDNEIYYDHVKPVNIVSCFTLNFHNARAGAAIQRGLGVRLPIVIGEGWYNLARRPQELWRAVHRRHHELPVGTPWRLHIVGLSFCLGTVIGALFGAGRSAHKID